MNMMLEEKAAVEQSFYFRAFQDGDAAGVIECFEDEYGRTYLNQQVYDPSYIAGRCRDGTLNFVVAQAANGEIAGILGSSLEGHFQNIAEIGMYIIKRKFRCLDIGPHLIRLLMALVEERAPKLTAYHTHFSTVSAGAQTQFHKMGFVPCGFEFSRFDNSILLHNGDNGKNLKQSLAIAVKKMSKNSCGILFVPEPHRDFARQIYNRIGVEYSLAESSAQTLARQRTSRIEIDMDAEHRVGTIFIERIGKDLSATIKSIIAPLRKQPGYSASLYLSILDSASGWAFKEFRQQGFFFAGLQPLCQSGEYLVMHNPLDIPLHPEDLRVAGDFPALLDYIGRCR
ncbi:MAG: hypothetical protein ABFD04_10765 [Syntrophomonas sp.]